MKVDINVNVRDPLNEDMINAVKSAIEDLTPEAFRWRGKPRCNPVLFLGICSGAVVLLLWQTEDEFLGIDFADFKIKNYCRDFFYVTRRIQEKERLINKDDLPRWAHDLITHHPLDTNHLFV